jgi:alpha-L-fucosidase 2
MKTAIPSSWTFPVLRYDKLALDSSDSIPLGNGDVGINLWAEENGDLLFYLAKSDAVTERNHLSKLGRIRISMNPNPFAAGNTCSVSLDIRGGLAMIRCKEMNFEARVWVNAHSNHLHVDLRSDRELEIRVGLESWRKTPRRIYKVSRNPFEYQESNAYIPETGQKEITVSADFFEEVPDGIVWGHQNPERTFWDQSVENAWMEAFKDKVPNPLGHRIFGARIEGDGLRGADRFTLTSEKPLTRCRIKVSVLSEQEPRRAVWLENLRALADSCTGDGEAFERHRAWWEARSDRHYLHVSGDAEAEHAGMCYALQRYVTLCAARGRFPIRFNGSIFTVDWNVEHDNGYHESYNADFRRWGNFIFVQNVRWAYWGMLTSGDAEHMKVLFRVYTDSLESARLRCQKYFGFDGLQYQDSITDWGIAMGLAVNSNPSMENHIRDSWSTNYVSSVLEILLMALDYVEFTGDERVLEELITPATVLVARFYLNRCGVDDHGKLIIKSSALEQYHKTVNPMPDVAGLHTVMGTWLARNRGTEEERGEVETLLSKLPGLPLGRVRDEYAQLEDRWESRWHYIGVLRDRPPQNRRPGRSGARSRAAGAQRRMEHRKSGTLCDFPLPASFPPPRRPGTGPAEFSQPDPAP